MVDIDFHDNAKHGFVSFIFDKVGCGLVATPATKTVG
jgi:hypothetical protein